MNAKVANDYKKTIKMILKYLFHNVIYWFDVSVGIFFSSIKRNDCLIRYFIYNLKISKNYYVNSGNFRSSVWNSEKNMEKLNWSQRYFLFGFI